MKERDYTRDLYWSTFTPLATSSPQQTIENSLNQT